MTNGNESIGLRTEFDGATHVTKIIGVQRIEMYRIVRNEDGTFCLTDPDFADRPVLIKTLEQLREEGFNPIEYEESCKAVNVTAHSIQVVSSATKKEVGRNQRWNGFESVSLPN